MQWTPEQITQLVTVVGSVLGIIFSRNMVMAFIKFLEWWREWRERSMAQRALDEELNIAGHKYIIRRQDKRITELENHIRQSDSEHDAALDSLRKDHDECERRSARQEVRIASLEETIQELRRRP